MIYRLPVSWLDAKAILAFMVKTVSQIAGGATMSIK